MAKNIFFKRRGISFITSLTIYFTVIVFYNFFHNTTIGNPLTPTNIIFIGIYMVIGLASVDWKPISMLVERIWSLNCADGVDDDAKLQTIRAYIAINVIQWDKYWRLYQEICENKSGLWTTKQKIKEQVLRIPKGTLGLEQFIWIMSYVTYNVLQNTGFIPFLPEDFAAINFLIDIAGLGFFSYTSGVVIGMGKFMTKIFESIRPTNERDVKASLRLLEQHIIFGARHYGFLRDMMDIKCDLSPEYFNQDPENIELKKGS